MVLKQKGETAHGVLLYAMYTRSSKSPAANAPPSSWGRPRGRNAESIVTSNMPGRLLPIMLFTTAHRPAALRASRPTIPTHRTIITSPFHFHCIPSLPLALCIASILTSLTLIAKQLRTSHTPYCLRNLLPCPFFVHFSLYLHVEIK